MELVADSEEVIHFKGFEALRKADATNETINLSDHKDFLEEKKLQVPVETLVADVSPKGDK